MYTVCETFHMQVYVFQLSGEGASVRRRAWEDGVCVCTSDSSHDMVFCSMVDRC